MAHGMETSKFGDWLGIYIQDRSLPYRVFYDHAKKKSPNVGKIQGFVSEQAIRNTILTNADVMVVDGSNKIKILIEIEDKASLSPKKLIGSVFSTLFCTSFAFGIGQKKKYFSITPDTIFIMAGHFKKGGDKIDQLNEVIKPRLLESGLPEGGIMVENVFYVFEGNLEKTIEVLERKVKEILE